MAQNRLIKPARRLLPFCLLVIFSCNNPKKETASEDAKKIAQMQCLSRELTHQKFLLANEYGTLDQQILAQKISADSALQVRERLDQQKSLLVRQSQEKSDELLQFLRTAWKEKYKTGEQRRMLDSLTELELRHSCNAVSP